MRREPDEPGFGGFSLGEMRLALPMAALREVVPCTTLSALPCAAACVVGAIDLRGVTLPVIDLSIVLGQEVAAAAHRNVIVMVHEGRLLGLMVGQVSGVFHAEPGSLKRVSAAGPGGGVLVASLRGEDGALVSVLSHAALFELPQVPAIEDPEPARQAQATGVAEVATDDPAVPVMLVACNRLSLAIDALAVHATLSSPRIEASALAMGHCLGVTEYGGGRIPIVDLLALCGLGALDTSRGSQAFVMQMQAGLVGLLVEAVLDVVPSKPQDRMSVPAYALPVPGLFSGALPSACLAIGQAWGDRPTPQQYLLLDSAALKAHPELVALASTNSGGLGTPPNAGDAGTAAASAPQRSLITYELFGEEATPIEQVAEILPYQPEAEIFGNGGALRALMVNRGRSIPVLCLRRLAGLEPLALTRESSVLVVQTDGDWTGFAVPRLRAIESTSWEPALPAHGLGAPDPLARVLKSNELALVDSGGTERMLRVLNLERIARSLQAHGLAA
jgi:purine-binding chemotaxis protein CheW